ncbi:MAG: GNAT family N-acetyltransferase [Patescibacteria group bacterium]|nr:GNAT family N-acetyltransferase [Patescibacteria group bacterium]
MEITSVLSQIIYGESQMLPVSPEELLESIRAGLAVLIMDPDFLIPIGFARIHPCFKTNEKGESVIAALELGSVYVDPAVRGFGLAKLLIKALVKDLTAQYDQGSVPKVPLFAVVEASNVPSLNLFRGLGGWIEQPLSPEETNNYTEFWIGGVNIFEGWGKPSVIFWYNENNERHC